MSESNFVKLCDTLDILENEMKIFNMENIEFVVVNQNKKFNAVYNKCPHMGGSLGDGSVDSANLDKICQDSGGKRTGDTCLAPITIINPTKNDSPNTVSLSQLKTMKPDSVELFYYPNIKDSEKKDTCKLFMLIRLPEWIGGDANDASAFRAYSAKSLDDACIVKYWSNDERQHQKTPKGIF